MLIESELEVISGAGVPWNPMIDLYGIGEIIGRGLAHQPARKWHQPICYHYGPAYPAPVLPC
ncbi:hypothetical protein [Streptococcus pacificus]|uniref:Uncharacterized protein n=1 Tax=Streptococcus pacificus TaxID=2740577 RepID=A0ABS0ZJB1_9STRE|nr:hypothetical protein [Streptococcus pacificus]MBJ8326061.1 hypothetical protein [Streptococcus pacificus]